MTQTKQDKHSMHETDDASYIKVNCSPQAYPKIIRSQTACKIAGPGCVRNSVI
uniref:Uncharacterized protein n=1 Tax=Setaria italica TaxID=4555 RepID=K3YBN0_SETIT